MPDDGERVEPSGGELSHVRRPNSRPPELAAFVRWVESRGRARPRRVLTLGATAGDVEALRRAGLHVVAREVAELGRQREHAFDGIWLGDAALPEHPDQLAAIFADVFRVLHHGFVRVPIRPDERWRMELLLERAHLRVVEAHGGLIAWTKLVPPLLGAGAAIFDRLGRVLLTDRADGRGWCLPGGVCDPEESPQETVVREVSEETGLAVEIEELLGVYSGRNIYGRIVVVEFLCRVVSGTPVVTDETLDLGWFAEQELPDRLIAAHRPRIADAFAVRRGEMRPPFVRDFAPIT